MRGKTSFAIICMLFLAISIAGCTQYVPPEQAPADSQQAEPKETAKETDVQPEPTAQSQDVTSTSAEEQNNNQEETMPAEEAETIEVAPVPEKKTYKTPEPEPSSVEKDTCGCSSTWDPICSNDGKTYINRCLFECFGRTADEIKTSNQCLKDKESGVYTDDIQRDFEPKKDYGGYCWRTLWRSEDFRACDNLIVNGRVDDEPAPAKGNWLDQEHLVADMFGRKESYTINLKTGMKANNMEFNTSFQPLFKEGEYIFSFWARQGASSNNDWKVELTLMDWWDEKPMPTGVKGCYYLSKEIDAQEVYIETLPHKWRHYHFEFEVPLKIEEWTIQKRRSSECEYQWDMMPHGYEIDITGPTFGEAWFDDFSLEAIK